MTSHLEIKFRFYNSIDLYKIITYVNKIIDGWST
jgi:hypothetical protein